MSTPIETVDKISHKAIVTAVNIAEANVTVRISDSSECGGCPAARLCGGSSSRESLTIPTRQAASFSPGDTVNIEGTERMHHKAIMLATVLPCIALVAVMLIIYLTTFNQLAAALGGIAATLIFFNLLYFFRNRIAHEFTFTVTHAD